MPMKPELSPDDHNWPVPSFPTTSAPDAGAATKQTRSTSLARDEFGRGATLRLVRRCRFDATSVFAAWVQPALAGRWLFATATRPMVQTRIDARAGGGYCLTERRKELIVEHRGHYVHVASPRRLAFTLSTPDVAGETLVAVDIEPRPNGCAMTVTHAHIRPKEVRRVRQRWVGLLYGLVATLELTDIRSHRNQAEH
jgi:uncharacterized protein YndB with AHSA1/START domain